MRKFKKLIFHSDRCSFFFRRVCLLLMVILMHHGLFAALYYVAKSGSDTNSGTSLNTPFLTIQKAADVALPGDVINVGAGVYREMINMKADGVTYQANAGETVTINGTELLTSWELESGTTYKSVMNWNVDDNWGTNQAFCDGKMIEIARWPDQTSVDIIMPTNAKADNAYAAGGNSFTIKDNDFNEPDGRWVGSQIWVNLSHNGNDGEGFTGLVSGTNQASHTITVEDYGGEPRFGNIPWGLGQNTEYFLYNPTATGVSSTGGVNAVLSPGEWWKDGDTFYVKTPDEGIPSLTDVGINLIEAKKNHFAFYTNWNGFSEKANYTIRNFTLFACAIATHYNSGDRTLVEGAHDILIEGIKAKYVSHELRCPGISQDRGYQKSGFVISGRNITMRNCTIQYAAASAISVQGFGNKILNCEVRDANYGCSNAGAINTGFLCTNVEIGNCKIINTPIMGINAHGFKNDNANIPDVARIHHNEIADFMRRSGDSGGIDQVAVDAQWARIDHNIIYNAPDAPMQHGIYLDFGGGSNLDVGRMTIDHNVIYNVWVPGLFNHIKQLNIYNNIFLNSGTEYSAINANAGATPVNGENIKMYNNIFSKKPNNDNCCYGATMNNADIKNFIHIAEGISGTSLNDLFVDAANKDYHLKPTAFAAINKGISVGDYDDDNVIGAPDIGAYEFLGTIITDIEPISGSVENISAYPNPAKNTFEVSVPYESATISIVSLQGKLMQTTATNTKITTINSRDLPAGLYIVLIQSESESAFRKIVIAN
jgi:hypothetical protein